MKAHCILGKRDFEIQGWALGTSKLTLLNKKGRKVLPPASEKSKLGGQVVESWATWTASGELAGVLLTSQTVQGLAQRAGLGDHGGTIIPPSHWRGMAAAVEYHESWDSGHGLFLAASGWSSKKVAATER